MSLKGSFSRTVPLQEILKSIVTKNITFWKVTVCTVNLLSKKMKTVKTIKRERLLSSHSRPPKVTEWRASKLRISCRGRSCNNCSRVAIAIMILRFFAEATVATTSCNHNKHRKNCECCPGHCLIVNHYSSMLWFKFCNLSVKVNCVTNSLREGCR